MDAPQVQLPRGTVKTRVRSHLVYRTNDEGKVTFAQPESIPYPIKCWWCGHCIESPIADVQIPRHYDRRESEVVVFGHFHTVGCATAYLYEHFMTTTQERRIFYAWKMWLKDHYDIQMKERPPMAPHFSQLVDFGGSLTRAQFDTIAKSGAFLLFLPPTCVSLPMVQEMTLRLTDPKQAAVVNTMVTSDKGLDLNKAKAERNNRHRSGPLAGHTIARPFKRPQPFRSLGDFIRKTPVNAPPTPAAAATPAAPVAPAAAAAAAAASVSAAATAAPSSDAATPATSVVAPATPVADLAMPPPPPVVRLQGPKQSGEEDDQAEPPPGKRRRTTTGSVKRPRGVRSQKKSVP